MLTHTLHYGTGVFEGIRAYETDRGPGGVPADRAHRAAVQLGADHADGDPVHGRRDREGGEGHRARRPVCRRATSGRSRTTATARWGSTRCRARSTCRSRAGRGARTSATTRSSKGVRMKISSWTRHDHNTMPPLAKTTGNYVNSSLAKVEALKAGYDEAIMLNPDGLVSECTGENIFAARRGVLVTPPVSAGALPGHHAGLGHDDRARPRLRGRASTTSRAATSTSPRRCSCAAPRPR